MRDKLAEYAHNAWSRWMVYLFSRCHENPDGTITIPAWAVRRWKRQSETAYQDLSYEEQNSDLQEADEMIKIVENHEHNHR